MSSGMVMKVVELADGRPHPGAGQYVKSMDFEARDGRGSLSTCLRKEEAMRFATVESLLEYWGTQSRTVPLRDDGRPNRPLTAFTITTELVP